MPNYRLTLWSTDLRRCIACELGGEGGAAALLDRFEAAGRSALKLSAAAARGSRLARAT